MYAVNDAAPRRTDRQHQLRRVTNLFFRAMRKRIPTRGTPLRRRRGPPTRGASTGRVFRGYSEPFDLQKAKSWAKETSAASCCCAPTGTRPSRGRGTSPSCCPPLRAAVVPQHQRARPELGLHHRESHAGGYYKEMVHPSSVGVRDRRTTGSDERLELAQLLWHAFVVEAEKMREAAHRDFRLGVGYSPCKSCLAAAAMQDGKGAPPKWHPPLTSVQEPVRARCRRRGGALTVLVTATSTLFSLMVTITSPCSSLRKTLAPVRCEPV
jgi:hypothetical protein